jgi:hypothetical protein
MPIHEARRGADYVACDAHETSVRPTLFIVGALAYVEQGASNDELIDMSYGLINAAKDRRCETVSSLREIGSLQ